ncbi:MAG: 3-deoxy-manno-octulosonate cytidylyltransferase [bacterium ADurb.Bin243]|nr:MAG: 3-deoxy-manno-octulosonate cytidylyltransferase [bacterium ADurb.Bin243]
MKRNNLKIIGVIPARLESTRFPKKPLALIDGKEMIVWVARAASKAKCLSKLIVATDSEEIASVVRREGFDCCMTSVYCRSGSDRICEVAMKTEGDIFINIQGDEPLIEPALIDSLAEPFDDSPEIGVATAITPIASEAEFNDPGSVKVVIDKKQRALYFSRAPIPHFRNRAPELSKAYKHIGIYAYTRNALIDFANLAKTDYEEAESLEQLRLLENGYVIHCVKTAYSSKGVDTPADLEEVVKIINQKKKV